MVGHKVGTVLVRNMMHSMPGIRRVDCYDLHTGGYDWNCWPRVLAAANASDAPLIIVDPLYDWTMEGMYEALGDRIRIVVATRDPAERALSEYYYDLKATHPHEGVVSYRKPITIDDGASFWLPNRTQQESLRLLPPLTAVLMAARMGSSDNERIASIARRILSGPPYSTVATLADLVEGSLSHFDATWRSVFRFLLLPESADHTEADLEACLRIAQHQNLAGMNHSATHQTNTAAVHIEREQLKKALLGSAFFEAIAGEARRTMGYT